MSLGSSSQLRRNRPLDADAIAGTVPTAVTSSTWAVIRCDSTSARSVVRTANSASSQFSFSRLAASPTDQGLAVINPTKHQPLPRAQDLSSLTGGSAAHLEDPVYACHSQLRVDTAPLATGQLFCYRRKFSRSSLPNIIRPQLPRNKHPSSGLKSLKHT